MFSELVQSIKEDYKLKGQERPRIKHLKGYFEGTRAVDITTSRIKGYINHRLDEGASNAKIKLELAALKRMFNLGARKPAKSGPGPVYPKYRGQQC